MKELETLKGVRIDPAWAFKIPETVAMRRLALPLCVVDGVLDVAMPERGDEAAVAAIRAAAGLDVAVVVAPRDEIRAALLRVYGDIRSAESRQGAANDPVAIVDRILRAAALRQASDIHVNPRRGDTLVRMRIDGCIEDFTVLSSDIAPAVASRIKVMSGLDIAERRAPQDGAFAWTPPSAPGAAPAPLDIRVATLPVRHGERITLRLLEAGRERLTLGTLGMSSADMDAFRSVLARPHGLVLMTGPTGSGKTTTLYAAIRELLSRSPLNILTVEDPVEYEIEGVAQAEVDSGDKVSFGKALRSLLRHDPDAIMIGEIRDEISLDTAVKAALTGHLVLSTLHTNDAPSAVTRLRDMGLAPHILGATLRLCAAQRLVRRLCPHCREEDVLGPADASLLGRPDLAGRRVWRRHGCLACAGRGYSGRIGVFELMAADASLASLLASGATEDAIRAALAERGAKTLADDAVEKLLAGNTDFAEIVRSIGADGNIACNR